MSAAVAYQLNDKQAWHRDQLVRHGALTRFLAELHVMSKSHFRNLVRAKRGQLRPYELPGRARFASRPRAGAWELLEWLAGACTRWRQTPDGRRLHFNAIEVPWYTLAGLCGCVPSQLAEHALPWLIKHELVHREYRYQYTSKRRPGWRRDGSSGKANMGPCVLMLGPKGEALVKHRQAAQAAGEALAALRRYEARVGAIAAPPRSKNSDPSDSASSVPEETDPTSIRKALQYAWASGGEGAAAAPPPSTVTVERLRRELPLELRPDCLPLGYGVDEQPRRRQNRNEPDGQEGQVRGRAGGAPKTGAVAAQAPPGEAIAPPATSPPSPDPTALYQARLRLLKLQLVGQLSAEEVAAQVELLERGELDPQSCGRNVGDLTLPTRPPATASSSPPEESPGGAAAPITRLPTPPPPKARLPSTQHFEGQPTRLGALLGRGDEYAVKKLSHKAQQRRPRPALEDDEGGGDRDDDVAGGGDERNDDDDSEGP